MSAFADPAKGGSAYAYGLGATGTIPIARTPESRASQPPDSAVDRNAVLELPLSPLAIDATIGTVAVAHRDSNVRTNGASFNGSDSDPQTLQDVNSRGFARTDGLSVVVSAGELVDAITDPLIEQGLVGAEAVQSEAVAKCVNDRPVFETGYDIVGLGLAGGEIELVGELVDALTDLLGPGEVLSPVVTVEKGVVTRPTPDTIAIVALIVTVPLLNERIVISHSEATLPQDCGFDCSDHRDNDGDGKIDFGPDPGCDSPFDDDERDAIRTGPAGPALAATGGDMGALPMVAFGMLGLAVIGRRMTVRSYRKTS